MKLVRADDKQELGRAEIDLAAYAKCLDRKLFSCELAKSQFPEAIIDFYITASPVVGTGRAATGRATSGGQDIVTSSQAIQSTRNGNSFNFNEDRMQAAKTANYSKRSSTELVAIDSLTGAT